MRNRVLGLLIIALCCAGFSCSKPKTHPYMEMPDKKFFLSSGYEVSRKPILDKKPAGILELTRWIDQMTPDPTQFVTMLRYEEALTREEFVAARDHWNELYGTYGEVESVTIDGQQGYWYMDLDTVAGQTVPHMLIAMVPYETVTWIVMYYAAGGVQPESIMRHTVKSFRLSSKQKFYKRP